MGRHFPKQVKDMASACNVKKAFISDISPVNPNDCENCGGIGTLTLFLATKGPFQSPSSNREDCNKFEKDVGWWVGQHYSITCPDCDGIGISLKMEYSRPPENFRPTDYKQITADFRAAAMEREES